MNTLRIEQVLKPGIIIASILAGIALGCVLGITGFEGFLFILSGCLAILVFSEPFLGVIITVALIPLGGLVDQYLSPIHGLSLLGIIALLGTGVQLLRGKIGWSVKFNLIILLVLSFLTLTFSSGIWSYDLTQWRSRAFELAQWTSFFFLVIFQVNSLRRVRWVAIVMVIAIIISSGIGIWQYLTNSPSLLVYAGRATGGMDQPNYFATYVATSVPLAIAATHRIQGKIPNFISQVIILAFAIGGVLVSESRGGLLTVVFIVIALVLWPSENSTWFQRIGIGLTTGMILFTVLIVNSTRYLGSLLINRFREVFLLTGTPHLRWGLILLGWKMFLKSPLLGIGAGNYISLMQIFRSQDPSLANYLDARTLAPHDAYISILAELGLIGFIIFFGLFSASIQRLWAQWRMSASSETREYTRLMIISLAGLLVNGVSYELELHRVLWLILSLSYVILNIKTGPFSESSLPLQRPFRR